MPDRPTDFVGFSNSTQTRFALPQIYHNVHKYSVIRFATIWVRYINPVISIVQYWYLFNQTIQNSSALNFGFAVSIGPYLSESLPTLAVTDGSINTYYLHKLTDRS